MGIKLWAHRGCSQNYPENTLTAFEKAAELEGLAGIELDIQLTKDGKIVVIHDETVDRTTNGHGAVKDFTFADIKNLEIAFHCDGKSAVEHIPSIEEVLDRLAPKLAAGLRLNIELKNSVVPYHGMEGKIVRLARKRGLLKNIVFSSFNFKSLETIRRLAPGVETGILAAKVSDCANGKRRTGANALHPHLYGIDLPPEKLKGETVRAWGGGSLYPAPPAHYRPDFASLREQGVTDIFINNPEEFLAVPHNSADGQDPLSSLMNWIFG